MQRYISPRLPICLTLILGLAGTGAQAADTSLDEQLSRWSAAAGAPADAARGKRFFDARHGSDWSCSSCHGMPPTSQGKHASTGKNSCCDQY